jgi:hypothetical protein
LENSNETIWIVQSAVEFHQGNVIQCASEQYENRVELHLYQAGSLNHRLFPGDNQRLAAAGGGFDPA